MRTIIIQDDEADALEAMLDKALISGATASNLFQDGAQRRKVKRVSMKLHWAKTAMPE